MNLRKSFVAIGLGLCVMLSGNVSAFTPPPGSGGTWVTVEVCGGGLGTFYTETFLSAHPLPMCMYGGTLLLQYNELKAPSGP